MLHNVMLCYRSATAPLPTGAATLAGTYPADIAPTESLFYDAGASTRFRLPCSASKGRRWARCGGQVCRRAALSVDGATFASRTLGGGQGLPQSGADGTALHRADAAADRNNTPISMCSLAASG